jgi:hypothetical protein
MTVDVPENKEQITENQEKVDTNLKQQKVDTNLKQQSENKEQTPEDPNWRAFREARKKDRAEKEAAERRAAEKEAEANALKAAMEAAFSKNSPSPQAYQQYYNQNDQEETEDERIEKKVNALLSLREEKARKEWEERERQELPLRLKRDFPDFHHVTSQENLDYLDFHFPEISRPLQRLPNDYDKWADIYHAIKKFIPNQSNARKDTIRADINQQKPKSISSTGLTQSEGNARQTWQEIEQRRAANWERMQRVIKGLE